MSSFTARKCEIRPASSLMEVISARSQNSEPSFALFKNSPDHSPPAVMVCHSARYSSSEVCPDLRIRGFFPSASADV